MRKIRVMIADDEAELRGALADLIASEEDLELVGAAADADEAVELARSNRPDVALVDVRMPGGGGPRAARGISRWSPGTRVLALSAYEDRSTVLEMLGAGAVGYLVKGTAPDEIVHAIGRAIRGQTSLSADVMAGVVHELTSQLKRTELESEERNAQLERIRAAVAGEGVSMVFQPIYDLSDQTVVGVEALARFSQEPVRGPDRWFSEAKEAGLGIDLELTTAQLALAQTGQLPKGVYLAINLSHRTAMSPRFHEALAAAPADRIVIELTEHEQIDDYEALDDALGRIREKGGRLAIDDAGAGFASLRHTLRLAPNIIKLDISLTRDIDSDRGRRALASALISFAEEMGMTIVAEGIETGAEVEALLALGVRFGQGYFLAYPGPLA